ncbi:MAG: hypothetical protein M1817_003662 [Caeruleum heppii]|nr:MAG: hypothetical protein M1817_003662 [Caeruleum heppii]
MRSPWSVAAITVTVALSLCAPVLAIYNDDLPHVIENFDPAEANPRGHIFCAGPLPDFSLPQLSDFDPRALTLQELCAKPQYGGRARLQHVSAYCADDRTGMVAFDLSHGAEARYSLMNPRLLLYCRTRCWCSYGRRDTSRRPMRAPQWHRTTWRPAHGQYQITLDIYDDWLRRLRDHTGKGTAVVPALELPLSTQIVVDRQRRFEDGPDYYNRLGISNPRSQVISVSLDPHNNITCDGPMPPWPAPRPLRWIQGQPLNQLCAVQLSGGNVDVNAGGYCHRLADGTKVVWFADEMTPRLEMTWDNFPRSLALRWHCWLHCRCAEDPPEQDRKAWPLTPHAEVYIKKIRDPGGALVDGPVVVHARSMDGSTKGEVEILPAFRVGVAPVVGTCGPQQRGFCSQAWPASLLGPIPTAPPGAASPPVIPTIPPDEVSDIQSLIISTSPAQHTRPPRPPSDASPAIDDLASARQKCAAQNQQQECTCGGSCTSVAQGCSWHHLGLCKCTAKPFWDNPFGAFSGACTAVVSAYGAKMRRDAVGMGQDGNTTVMDLTASEMPQGVFDAVTLERVACPCNASYVSYACCESADGIVHEGPEHHLGTLVEGDEEVSKAG